MTFASSTDGIERRLRGACILLVCAALGACGGGGGSGDAGMTTSGLLPAAPTAGTVLAADAGTVRPLAASGRWEYHGTDRVPGVPPVVYRNLVVHRGAAGTSVEERSSNGFNEGESISMPQRSGSDIVSPIEIAFPGQPTETLQWPELRSPVRTGDQWTLYDRRLRGVYPDLDGDQRAEDGDFVFYARVVGLETVSLPSLGQVEAVRVDYTALQRPRFSQSGNPGAVVVSVVQTNWFAAGIGIVQVRLDEPTDSPGGRRVREEVLLGFDRGEAAAGLGAVRTVTASGVPMAPKPESLMKSIISRAFCPGIDICGKAAISWK
jgi:hypothetical protein